MNQQILKYLADLVNCESVTPSSSGSIEYIDQLLSSYGFSVTVKTFGTPDYQVINLYAVYGNAKPNICFTGHVDVVPAGELSEWSYPPFSASFVKDKIYGRGTVDMKGAISSALAAAINFIEQHPKIKGSISFLLTSDEEGSAQYGIRKMLPYLADKNHIIDFAILGEPTSERVVGDRVKIGRRGSVNFTLTIFGVQGHVAYPEFAENPIDCLIKIIYELSNYTFDYGSKFFKPSELVVTSIDVDNQVTNIIPNSASARFNVRFNDLHSEASIAELVKKNIEKYTDKYQLLSETTADVFLQQQNYWIDNFIKLVASVTGTTPQVSTDGGTSDARFIKDYCSVVEFGLLNKTAHKIDEYTTISDLQRLCSVYYKTLSKFLG